MRSLIFLFGAAICASAHQQPTTLLMLSAGSDRVSADIHVPLSELELAFGHNVTEQPGKRLPEWQQAFKSYLVQHIRPATESGEPWRVDVGEMIIDDSTQTQSGPFQEVCVRLVMTPPARADVRNFTLNYDLILHQVVTHKAIVSIHSNWEAGQVSPTRVGVIEVDTGSGRIAPMPVHFDSGSWWQGFTRMVALGAEHIREGTDHLLFLLVLLLPATLTVSGGRWAEFGGSEYSMKRLVRIVTAFTAGHSVTLLAGALHWLALPQQPVEVLIAVSILVTAVHAVRPIFPGREMQLAAGCGLVHGLAFATVLADLKLEPAPMALSIFGFNLGIELMQLFAVALTMPWLIILSNTAAHRYVRVGGASLAAVASCGWIANRVTGDSNVVERAMTAATQFAPLGILILAGIALTNLRFREEAAK